MTEGTGPVVRIEERAFDMAAREPFLEEPMWPGQGQLRHHWGRLERVLVLCCRRRRTPMRDDNGEFITEQAEHWLWIRQPTRSSQSISGGWRVPDAEVPPGGHVGIPPLDVTEDDNTAIATGLHPGPSGSNPIRNILSFQAYASLTGSDDPANVPFDRWKRVVYKFVLWDELVTFSSCDEPSQG